MQEKQIEKLIKLIINYKQPDTNSPLLLKFTVQYIISIMDRDKIVLLEKSYKDYSKKGVDIIDFVRIFLNIIDHTEEETLYLVMALIEFFRIIAENANLKNFIKYIDITNYICELYGD